jgi:5-methylcytosine-specific restriction endonuclease McrA
MISKNKRLAIYIRDKFECVYCCANLRSVGSEMRTVDHIKTVSSGGKDEHWNLITSCFKCNNKRGNLNIFKFADADTLKRIRRQTNRSIKLALRKANKIIELENSRSFTKGII